MSEHRTTTRSRIPVVGTAVIVWVATLFWLFPSRVVPTGDDFGYLDSVVSTVRAQRVRVSDWLEPLNLPLPALSALCYAATGNFHASTFGLNLLLGVASFI